MLVLSVVQCTIANLFSYLKVEHYLISLIYYALDHCTACNTFRFIIVYTAGYSHGNSVGKRVMNNAENVFNVMTAPANLCFLITYFLSLVIIMIMIM